MNRPFHDGADYTFPLTKTVLAQGRRQAPESSHHEMYPSPSPITHSTLLVSICVSIYHILYTRLVRRTNRRTFSPIIYDSSRVTLHYCHHDRSGVIKGVRVFNVKRRPHFQIATAIIQTVSLSTTLFNFSVVIVLLLHCTSANQLRDISGLLPSFGCRQPRLPQTNACSVILASTDCLSFTTLILTYCPFISVPRCFYHLDSRTSFVSRQQRRTATGDL